MAWFQVDDQLAMHRKVCDAGNAAMGLWVRAGSWSMQNLTEGRIPAKIARTLGTTGQAARLVEAGLWIENVTENGKEFAFHEWGTRQLSAEQISERRRKRAEAGRKGGTSRKGGKREATDEANAQASASANAQASDQAKSKQNGTPVPVPVLSVVTKEGNVALVNAHEAENDPPSPTCPKHPNGTDLRCHACGEARERRKAFGAERSQRDARERADFWAAVRDCRDCDDHGLVDRANRVTRCPNHDWGLIHA